MLIQTGSPPCSPLLAKPPPLARAPQQSATKAVKCVLVGDGAVGKTSLLISYTTNGYPSEYQPTTYDDYNVVVMVNDEPVRLQLCDTAGQEDFDRLRPVWYQDADVFLVCFSVVSPSSFQNVPQKWAKEIRELRPQAALVLVGTQSDLRSNVEILIELSRYKETPVSESDARRMAHGIKAAAYVECSSLTQNNVKEVFDQCIVSGLESRRPMSPLVASSSSWPSPSNRRRKRNSWRRCFCM